MDNPTLWFFVALMTTLFVSGYRAHRRDQLHREERRREQGEE